MGLIQRRREQYKSVDNYLKELWRPMMAWFYALIVLFDFLIAPILLAAYTIHTKQSYIPWMPLTIQGGGMFHVAMGAVLGISAWTRGREKQQELFQDYDRGDWRHRDDEPRYRDSRFRRDPDDWQDRDHYQTRRESERPVHRDYSRGASSSHCEVAQTMPDHGRGDAPMPRAKDF